MNKTTEWLSFADVANLLEVSPNTVKSWIPQERGPAYYRIEGSIKYRREDVEAYLQSVRCEPKKKNGE